MQFLLYQKSNVIVIFTGLIWVVLNFIRLIIADTLYTKKLTPENKKNYLSKRKSSHLTAFVFDIT